MLNLTLYVSPIVSSNINDTNINDTNINDQSSSIIKCSSLRLIRYSSLSISYSINKEKKYYIVGIPFPPVLIHSLAKYLNIHTNGGFIEQKRKEKKKTIQDVILEKFFGYTPIDLPHSYQDSYQHSYQDSYSSSSLQNILNKIPNPSLLISTSISSSYSSISSISSIKPKPSTPIILLLYFPTFENSYNFASKVKEISHKKSSLKQELKTNNNTPKSDNNINNNLELDNNQTNEVFVFSTLLLDSVIYKKQIDDSDLPHPLSSSSPSPPPIKLKDDDDDNSNNNNNNNDNNDNNNNNTINNIKKTKLRA